MNKKYLSDYYLVQKALKGDRYAFEEIVNKYESVVAKTVIGFLGNTQEAEDTGQEVFIRFYRSMKQYKGESSLATYITRIAINLSLNELKKQKTKLNDDIEKHSFRLTTDDEEEKKDNVDIVTSALQQLDPEFRTVVVMRMIEGYSTKETAEKIKYASRHYFITTIQST